jgi:hypothetical protein
VHRACFTHHLTNNHQFRSTHCPPSLASRIGYDGICIRYQLASPPNANRLRKKTTSPRRHSSRLSTAMAFFEQPRIPVETSQSNGLELKHRRARTYKGTTTTSTSALRCRFQQIAALFHQSIASASRDSSTLNNRTALTGETSTWRESCNTEASVVSGRLTYFISTSIRSITAKESTTLRHAACLASVIVGSSSWDTKP